MELTDRYTAWLSYMAMRDNLVGQITFVALCLVAIYWLVVRGSSRAPLLLLAFVGVFYASLAAYWIMGL